jgi:purine-binding chemotaxis protein CheW
MTATPETTAQTVSAKSGKYLTFLLGKEFYALPVLKVREIIRLIDITPVPHMPAYVKGVINLRGKLVPVMDLRLRFELSVQAFTESTCIIVAQVKSANGSVPMGFIVDGVEEVLNLSPGEIEKTPEFGARLSTEYLPGMANVKDKVIALLDIDLVVDRDALEQIKREEPAGKT